MTRYLVCVVLLIVGCHGGGDVPSMITIQYPVVASADDGYYRLSTPPGTWGTIVFAGTSVIFGKQTIGPVVVTFRTFLRFALEIPAGATVTAATLNFDLAESLGSFAADINLIDADNCGDINSFANDQSDMTLVVGPIVWLPADLSTSPDITSIVQAYIDRPGYAVGQYIGLLIDEGEAGDNEFRSAASFDHLTAAAPILRVSYSSFPGDSYATTFDALTESHIGS